MKEEDMAKMRELTTEVREKNEARSEDNNKFFGNLKALPYQASRQAFEYTSTSRGQNAHAHHTAAARLPLLNLPPKYPAMLPSVAKKTRKSLTLEVKLDIIHRHERREN
ncbi:hypothetical protein E2C01_069728 [Portunus trituberculatus]|uniref:Uncharacterized protein n=1 Tax=Portunus trituberculatus TaxID=210409 RepID=A0A5B7HVB7_PORTR|nr:hypothetical protein [Portunus trituberculatus]